MVIATPETPALRKFLRLSTGADVVIGNDIQVTFTSITGAARRPIFHACSNVFELRTTYDDFCDFRVYQHFVSKRYRNGRCLNEGDFHETKTFLQNLS